LEDEQLRHSQRLAKFYPLQIVHTDKELIPALAAAIRDSQAKVRPTLNLNLSGVHCVRDIILRDLGEESDSEDDWTTERAGGADANN
jgi:hypothetical protein